MNFHIHFSVTSRNVFLTSRSKFLVTSRSNFSLISKSHPGYTSRGPSLGYLPPAIEAVQISWLAVHTTSLYIYRMIYSRRDGGGTHTPDPPHVVTFPHHLDFWWLIVCHGISCHLARRSSEIVLLTFAHERWPSPSVTHRMLPLTSPCIA